MLSHNFHLSFAALLFCQVAREETIRFLVFKLVITGAFRTYFPMFSQMLFLLVKKWIRNWTVFPVKFSEQF